MSKTLLTQLIKPIKLLLYATLASIILLVFLLFYTQTGFRLTLKAVEKYSDGKFTFEKPTGNFGKAMSFKKVYYREPERVIRLENVSVKWNPLALLRWHLQMDQLNIDKLIVFQKNVQKPKTSQVLLKKTLGTSPIALPQLPIYLTIKKIKIGEIRVRSQGITTFQLKNLRGNLALTSTQLAARLQTKLTLPVSMNGLLELSGDKKHYEFEVNFYGEAFNWSLAGRGDQTHLVFNTRQDEIFGGKLNLNGWIKSPKPQVNVKPASILSPKPIDKLADKKNEDLFSWKFDLTASNLQLDKIFPVKLNGTLTGEGRDKEGKLFLSLTDSYYNKTPLTGQATLQFDYPVVKNFNAQFFSLKNTLSIDGNIGETWNVQWKANIDNLKFWLPTLQGSLLSQGRILGSRETPEVQANLFMRELKIGEATVKSLRILADFNMASLDNSKVVLEAQQIKNDTFEVSNLTFLGNIQEITNGFFVNLNLQPGIFRYSVESKMQAESFGGGTLNMRFIPGKIITKFDVNLMGKSHFQGRLVLPSYIKRGSNQKIKGQLSGQVNNLSFLSGLTGPTFRNIQGQIVTDLQIEGTIGKPQIKSKMQLKGSAFLPVPNIHLKDIQLNARSEKQVVQYDGQAKSEDTVLHLTGKTVFKPKTVFSEFDLFSPNFLITNTNEITMYATPKIKIISKDGKTSMTGNIEISKAEIKPLDFSGVLTMPEDIQYVGEEMPTIGHQLPVETDLLITMGNQVYMRYQGMSGNLTGSVRIKSRPLQPTIGIGRIEFKEGSTFQIKGRELSIHQGYFDFKGGPLSNPSIQIKATRKIQVNNVGGLDPNLEFGVSEMLVGINITGNVHRHKVKLYSEPSGLSQSNILAYLITGQSLHAGASAYAPLILEAGETLGGGSNSNFAHQVKKGFGLTDISIQKIKTGISKDEKDLSTTSTHEIKPDRPALVFGKMISPVFYISYAVVDVIRPLSGFQARYQLTKHWVLQVSGIPGDKGASVDLIRTFESKH